MILADVEKEGRDCGAEDSAAFAILAVGSRSAGLEGDSEGGGGAPAAAAAAAAAAATAAAGNHGRLDK